MNDQIFILLHSYNFLLLWGLHTWKISVVLRVAQDGRFYCKANCSSAPGGYLAADDIIQNVWNVFPFENETHYITLFRASSASCNKPRPPCGPAAKLRLKANSVQTATQLYASTAFLFLMSHISYRGIHQSGVKTWTNPNPPCQEILLITKPFVESQFIFRVVLIVWFVIDANNLL